MKIKFDVKKELQHKYLLKQKSEGNYNNET